MVQIIAEIIFLQIIVYFIILLLKMKINYSSKKLTNLRKTVFFSSIGLLLLSTYFRNILGENNRSILFIIYLLAIQTNIISFSELKVHKLIINQVFLAPLILIFAIYLTGISVYRPFIKPGAQYARVTEQNRAMFYQQGYLYLYDENKNLVGFKKMPSSNIEHTASMYVKSDYVCYRGDGMKINDLKQGVYKPKETKLCNTWKSAPRASRDYKLYDLSHDSQ